MEKKPVPGARPSAESLDSYVDNMPRRPSDFQSPMQNVEGDVMGRSTFASAIEDVDVDIEDQKPKTQRFRFPGIAKIFGTKKAPKAHDDDSSSEEDEDSDESA